ncbi:hypothetical protein HELRODRAFT_165354 [Helobdella robusta]|uniref:Uncharacterized protein n=1 Tax=Helobdella robusta TaxID=6412 RepID=T1EWM6_HELRO|nr:hypothetical protein HELRODRAFT_165354 [Helobdella robusta]ESN91334.1 hypothetical protein HELRODRAFT_165354 [Helobdella robusta]
MVENLLPKSFMPHYLVETAFKINEGKNYFTSFELQKCLEALAYVFFIELKRLQRKNRNAVKQLCGIEYMIKKVILANDCQNLEKVNQFAPFQLNDYCNGKRADFATESSFFEENIQVFSKLLQRRQKFLFNEIIQTNTSNMLTKIISSFHHMTCFIEKAQIIFIHYYLLPCKSRSSINNGFYPGKIQSHGEIPTKESIIIHPFSEDFIAVKTVQNKFLNENEVASIKTNFSQKNHGQQMNDRDITKTLESVYIEDNDNAKNVKRSLKIKKPSFTKENQPKTFFESNMTNFSKEILKVWFKFQCSLVDIFDKNKKNYMKSSECVYGIVEKKDIIQIIELMEQQPDSECHSDCVSVPSATIQNSAIHNSKIIRITNKPKSGLTYCSTNLVPSSKTMLQSMSPQICAKCLNAKSKSKKKFKKTAESYSLNFKNFEKLSTKSKVTSHGLKILDFEFNNHVIKAYKTNGIFNANLEERIKALKNYFSQCKFILINRYGPTSSNEKLEYMIRSFSFEWVIKPLKERLKNKSNKSYKKLFQSVKNESRNFDTESSLPKRLSQTLNFFGLFSPCSAQIKNSLKNNVISNDEKHLESKSCCKIEKNAYRIIEIEIRDDSKCFDKYQIPTPDKFQTNGVMKKQNNDKPLTALVPMISNPISSSMATTFLVNSLTQQNNGPHQIKNIKNSTKQRKRHLFKNI